MNLHYLGNLWGIPCSLCYLKYISTYICVKTFDLYQIPTASEYFNQIMNYILINKSDSKGNVSKVEVNIMPFTGVKLYFISLLSAKYICYIHHKFYV